MRSSCAARGPCWASAGIPNSWSGLPGTELPYPTDETRGRDACVMRLMRMQEVAADTPASGRRERAMVRQERGLQPAGPVRNDQVRRRPPMIPAGKGASHMMYRPICQSGSAPLHLCIHAMYWCTRHTGRALAVATTARRGACWGAERRRRHAEQGPLAARFSARSYCHSRLKHACCSASFLTAGAGRARSLRSAGCCGWPRKDLPCARCVR